MSPSRASIRAVLGEISALQGLGGIRGQKYTIHVINPRATPHAFRSKPKHPTRFRSHSLACPATDDLPHSPPPGSQTTHEASTEQPQDRSSNARVSRPTLPGLHASPSNPPGTRRHRSGRRGGLAFHGRRPSQIGLLMPIFFIREARVVGLMPSNSAAPPRPETFHSVCFKAATMLSRSIRSRSSYVMIPTRPA